MDAPTEKQPPDVIASDTDNATQIRPSEAPPGRRQKFQKFRAYNTGLWNGPKRENKEAMHRQDDLHRYDALASSLGLTDQQKQRGRRILDSIEIDEFTGPSTTVDVVIFAICTLIANNAVEDGHRYYPPPDRGENDEQFSDVAKELGLDVSDQMSIIGKIRAKTDL